MPRKNWSTSFINRNKSVRTHLGRAQTIGVRHWMVWLYIKMGNKISRFVLIKLHHIYVQVATGQIATTGMVALSYVQKVSEKVSVRSYHFFTTRPFFFMSSFIPSLPCTGFPCIRFHVQSNDKGCNSKFRLWLYTETGILVFFTPLFHASKWY